MMKVGISACSNGLSRETAGEIAQLKDFLEGLGQRAVESSRIYGGENGLSGTGKEKARALMDLYEDPEIRQIYDVSGGDLANQVLDYLDYDRIRRSPAVFWGYSDLTTVLNAVFQMTGKPGVLYSVRNLTRGGARELQRQRFSQGEPLFASEITMVQGNGLGGILVGGNIRCLLKLAGTPFFPELRDRILLLEACGGQVPQMITYLSQLRSLGAFRKVRGILLGTFTKMEAEGCRPDMVSLVREFAGPDLPIGRTGDIGHGQDARAIWIGKEIQTENP